jgi:hypothetical protein
MLTMEIREKEGQLIVSRRDEKKTKKIIKLKKLEKNY